MILTEVKYFLIKTRRKTQLENPQSSTTFQTHCTPQKTPLLENGVQRPIKTRLEHTKNRRKRNIRLRGRHKNMPGRSQFAPIHVPDKFHPTKPSNGPPQPIHRKKEHAFTDLSWRRYIFTHADLRNPAEN